MVKVIDIDKGYRKILAALVDLHDTSAIVGIRQEKGADRYHAVGEPGNRVARAGGDLTLAEVATVLEFGTETIPERPFLRDTFDANALKYERIIVAGVERATLPANLERVNQHLREAIEVTAIASVGDVQEAMATRGAFAPNAPATIAIKGSSMPLIDTGRLRQSIDYEVTDEVVRRVTE